MGSEKTVQLKSFQTADMFRCFESIPPHDLQTAGSQPSISTLERDSSTFLTIVCFPASLQF